MAIHASDDLRSVAALHEPGPRSGAESPLPWRPTLDKHHADVARLRLPDFVPEDIRIHFLTACNALLYSWFVFRFVHVAELHALSTLEWALRDRFGGDPPDAGLGGRIRHAVEQGLLKDVHLRIHQRRMAAIARDMEDEAGWPEEFRRLFAQQLVPPNAADPQAIVRRLSRALPRLRNALAHGSPLLFSDGVLRVEICADLITQLYAPPEHWAAR